jgi:flavin-dependent dehydrogenase
LVGDAAGLVNNSLSHEGVNMAMASGITAAGTILERRQEKRYDAKALSLYHRRLQDSFVLGNMKSSRDFLDIMHTHRELVDDYPRAARDVLSKFFQVRDVPRRVAKREMFHMLRNRISFLKLARTFMAVLRAGV